MYYIKKKSANLFFHEISYSGEINLTNLRIGGGGAYRFENIMDAIIVCRLLNKYYKKELFEVVN